MSLENLIEQASVFILAFFNSINQALKLFFNDLPVLFGLRLGWWFLLFAILSIIISKIGGVR